MVVLPGRTCLLQSADQPVPVGLPLPPSRCDVDVRKDLYNNVVLTGGTAGFAGLRERLEKELADLAPQMAKVKASGSSSPTAACGFARDGAGHVWKKWTPVDKSAAFSLTQFA